MTQSSPSNTAQQFSAGAPRGKSAASGGRASGEAKRAGARIYSLAYLTAPTLTPPSAIRMAARLGYDEVGLRLLPNAPGAPQQFLIGDAAALRETLAAQRDTGVGVFDVEIIRIGENFDLASYTGLLEAGQALGARAVLVAGDDTNAPRLANNYARLCDAMLPYGLTADLEFMPWTAVSSANLAVSLVRDAGSPANAGILVDALHFARSATTLDDIRAIPRELLHYAQICDAPQALAGKTFTVDEMIHTARCERLLPGEGTIALAGLFAALPSDLAVSIEIPHMLLQRQLGEEVWSRQALDSSRAVLEPRI